eukprot:COSAG01_NODE_58366_length_306_cov_1.231884_1_plen_22_part_01
MTIRGVVINTFSTVRTVAHGPK